MESESIQLIVKSPNQSLKDFPVECRPDWSIRILKQRLSMVYPTKPLPSNQRLIHSGKLLQDHMIASEVLKQITSVVDGQSTKSNPPRVFHCQKFVPEGGGVITIHLVCIQATDEAVSPSSSSIATNSPPLTENRQSMPSTSEGRGQPSATPSTAATSNSHQYHRSMSMDSIYATNTPRQFWRQQSLATPPMYNPPNVAQATPPFVHPMYAAYMHHWYQQQQQLRHRNLSSASTGADLAERTEEFNQRQDHHDNQEVAAAPVAAERRDNEQFQDNVAVNAGPGMADMGQNDFRRDWVDSFYKLFSFLLLMTLVYFSASLSKFLAFAVVIILLLIYQAGWFSVRRNRQVRNPVRADGAVAGAQAADQVDRNFAGDTNGNNDGVDGVIEEEGPSVLGTVVMFITSFFTSLVPQRAPELAGN